MIDSNNLKTSLHDLLDGINSNSKIICFGTGGSAEKFLSVEDFDSKVFSYAIDNDEKKHGKKWKGLDVYPVNKLLDEPNKDNIFIIINSSFQVEICSQLEEIGFSLPQHQINGLAITLELPGEMLKLSRKSSLDELFSKIKEDINYCVMRSFKDLPENVPNWDIDLIIDSEGFENLKKIDCIVPNNKYSGLGIECYITPHSNSKITENYYPDYITKPALKNRKIYKEKLYVPDSYDYLILLAHTCLFLKSPKKTGIDYDKEEKSIDTKYVIELKSLRKELSKSFSISAKGLLAFLREESVSPPIDWARHIEIIREGSGEDTGWLRQLLKPKRRFKDKEIIVLVLRESGLKQDLQSTIVDFFLSQKDLAYNATSIFDDKTKTLATKVMRSGNWIDNNQNNSSGGPAGIISFIDNNPSTLDSQIHKKIYPYRGNRLYHLKNEVREMLNKKVGNKKPLNYIHSPDDEREALEYLSLLPNHQLTEHFCEIFSKKDELFFLKNNFYLI